MTRAVTLGLFATVVACGTAAAEPDAGLDAGVDAGTDAGSDSGIDAGRDASARRDGGDADFQPLAALPAGCDDFLIAARPEALPPLRWGPCFDGREGCEELIVDWGNWELLGTLNVAPAMYPHRGTPRIAFSRRGTPTVYTELLVANRDGTIERAVRAPGGGDPACFVGAFGPASFEDGRSLLGINGNSVGFRFGLVDLMDPERNVLLIEEDVLPTTVGTMRVSETGLITLPQTLGARFGVLREGIFERPSVPGAAREPIPIGDSVVFEDWSAPTVRLLRVDEADVLTVVAEEEGVTFGTPRTDGRHLVWIRAEGRHPEGRLLWDERHVVVADLSAGWGALVPRIIASHGPGPMIQNIVVQDGWVAWTNNNQDHPSTHAYRIEDGLEHTIIRPADHTFPKFLYVYQNELAVAVRPQAADRTIWRLRLPD